jgi:hypothetical protein
VGPQGDRRDCDSDFMTAARRDDEPQLLHPSAEAVRFEPAVAPPPALWARIEARLRRDGVIRS